jgi:hypothetical protein
MIALCVLDRGGHRPSSSAGGLPHDPTDPETAENFVGGATDLCRLLRLCGMEVVPVDRVGSSRLKRDQFSAFSGTAFGNVYRYLLRAVLGDHALAEDLTQETFAVAVAAARAGRSEALSLEWVLGVARHKVIDYYRTASRDRRRMSLVAAGSADVDDVQQLADQEPAGIVQALAGLSAAGCCGSAPTGRRAAPVVRGCCLR